MSMRIRLVLVHVRKEHEPDKMPTNKDVANYLDPKLTGEWADTWTIEGVTWPHFDVETLASLVSDANLTGEQTVDLMGRITADSVTKGIKAWAAKFEEENADAEADTGRTTGTSSS